MIAISENTQQKILKYSARIIVLYILSVVFKSFDLTFPSEMGKEFLRGQSFSLLVVVFGLAAWEVTSYFTEKIEKKFHNRPISFRLLVLSFGLLLNGVVVAFIFSFCYGVFDIVFFNRYGAWQSFSTLSYDLVFGVFIFYLLILGYNGIIYYYKNWKEAQLNTERLMRENIQAKYDVLKSQIEPHFFFNSLSVLTQLVYKSPELASEYITQLAKTYRYILDKKFENLVSVNTELEFLESYIFLIQIRHQDCIVLEIDIDEQVKNDGLLPPATLQMLIENAVKHNRFSKENHLYIHVKNENGLLIVSNNLNKRNDRNTTGVGLENIMKRYELASVKKVEIIENSESFIVKLPIIYRYESSHI